MQEGTRMGLATSPTKGNPESCSVLTSPGKLEEFEAEDGVFWPRSFRRKILSPPR